MDHLCCFVPWVSHAFAFVHCCLVVTCWERAALLVGVFIVFLLLSHVVFWVMCGAWLYPFLIFYVFFFFFFTSVGHLTSEKFACKPQKSYLDWKLNPLMVIRRHCLIRLIYQVSIMILASTVVVKSSFQGPHINIYKLPPLLTALLHVDLINVA